MDSLLSFLGESFRISIRRQKLQSALIDRGVPYLRKELDILLDILRFSSYAGDGPGDARDRGSDESTHFLDALALAQVFEYLPLARC